MTAVQDVRRRAVLPAGRVPPLATWVALCAAAEGIGMTAAAAASRAAQQVAVGPLGAAEAVAGLGLVVAGGLVEGLALGGLQAFALGRWLPGLSRVRWVAVTVLVAGLGWALASAPSALSGDTAASQAPPTGFVLVGAAALGALMGAVLGGAQWTVLRRHVRRSGLWVVANVLGWAAAMVLVFAGATAPGVGWPTGGVVALGAGTGLVAGAVLGLVTGWYLPSLDGAPQQEPVRRRDRDAGHQ